ncbi:MAG: formimidoylglutamate deiminase [Woeseia sp.]|nr:formimidoylglutamate deiminase [Woeseia sp.]MBT8097853.1 formimidoylglutamate deiminase [Woeseia sp.]NNE60291.1 formimidoylglutamate deiminase [Woeseia sp.]NNL55975.1 formimidoylglutamate deiminase [Woeseia sp.]
MAAVFARKALLPDGWRTDVRIATSNGCIDTARPDSSAQAGDVEAGVVIPGLCNAHSHAFQRALAGHTEQRGPAHRDNFWSWRERMYRLAGLIDAPRLTAIARQAYGEMVTSGFTSVAEFHYLHSEPGKAASDAMFEALLAAAAASGIRLTYIPVLYERGGFENEPLSAEQQRFRHTLPQFLAHYKRCRELAGSAATVGIGAHSLRAVSPESLAEIAQVSAADRVPLHVHIAEQQREVEQSLAVMHRRPVRWLLENFDVDERWCLVHATHVDADELSAMARTGAVVCLCPSTEANLGDGLFPLAPFLEQGGRIAIGSDSHVSINPFEELRWLEYGQRLVAEQRNIAAIGLRNTGRSLFERVAKGGALASGVATGRIAAGSVADLLLLDDDDPMLAGHDAETMLDALVFSGFSLPLERVMVNGVWRVTDGRHVDREAARAAYRGVATDIRQLFAELD